MNELHDEGSGLRRQQPNYQSLIKTLSEMYNLHSKVVESDHFRMQAGLPSFVLSPGQWIEKTNAIGMYVKQGKYGGTYAHKDIAFEFGSAIVPTGQ
jgi:hypothetical protein